MSVLLEERATPKLNRKDALLYASAQNMELLLDITAQVSDMFTQFSDRLGAEVARAAGNDGMLVPHRLLDVQAFVKSELSQLVESYRSMLDGAMAETVGYVQSAHLILYDYYLGSRALEESKGDFSGPFDIPDKYPHVTGFSAGQSQRVMHAAKSRTYGGTRNLSDRIWNLENGGAEKINQILLKGIDGKTAAVKIQKELEQYLKPEAKGTRWTQNRLYGQTSKERATGTKGLTRKPGQVDLSAGQSTKGMSYNALRLARNEVSQIHEDAYLDTVDSMPWVSELKFNLSTGHPLTDVCDGVASGGPNGGGIYPKGDYPGRQHVLCYCFPTSVLMNKQAFLDQVRGWAKGENHFLDDYSQKLGPQLSFDLGGLDAVGVNEPVVADEFVPAKTVADAEVYTRTHFAENVTYAKMDLEAANEANRALHEMIVKRGLPKLNSVTTSEKSTAIMDCLNGDIRIFPKAYSDSALRESMLESKARYAKLYSEEGKVQQIAALEAQLESAPEWRRKTLKRVIKEAREAPVLTQHNVGAGVHDVMIHEYGHHAHAWMSRIDRGGAGPLFGLSHGYGPLGGLGKTNVSIFKGKISPKGRRIAQAISEYAGKNTKEHFAEAWAAYMTGETGNLSQDVLKLIKQVEKVIKVN